MRVLAVALISLVVAQVGQGTLAPDVAPVMGPSHEPTAEQERAAQAAFEKLEPAHRAFLEGKLAFGDPKRLKAALTAQSRELNRLVADETKVAAMKVPRWAVAALVRAGELYWHFADELDAAPPPPGLTPEQFDLYKQQLEQQSSMVREKALDYWQRADALAKELGVKSPELEAVRPKLKRSTE